MRQFNPVLFLAVSRLMQTIEIKMDLPTRKHWRPHEVGGVTERISQAAKTNGDAALARFEPNCVELELTASLATIEKIRVLYSKPDAEYRTFGPLAEELNGRLTDEMQGRYFFALSMREAEYYSKPWKNWEEIVRRFPYSVSDIEEASKCFALSRYGAAVFHSLRTIEVGLIELGTFIGIADPKSGWTAVANRLRWTRSFRQRSGISKVGNPAQFESDCASG